MTTFYLPPPYHQPRCIQQLVARFGRNHTVCRTQNAFSIVPNRDDPTADPHGLQWSEISSNIIATVLGGALLALAGGVLYIAWQVPKQQELILYNQNRMRETLSDLSAEMRRLEANDRAQDNRLTKIEAAANR
jgi:hypothetical protein